MDKFNQYMKSNILLETKKLDSAEIKRRKILSNKLKLSNLSVKEAKAKTVRAAKAEAIKAARIAKLEAEKEAKLKAAKNAIIKKEKEKAAQQDRIEAHKADQAKRNLISSVSKFVNRQLNDPSFKKGSDGKWSVDSLTSEDDAFYKANKKQIDEYLVYELRKKEARIAQNKAAMDAAKAIKDKEKAAQVAAKIQAAVEAAQAKLTASETKKSKVETQKQQQAQTEAEIVDLPPITYS